MKKLLMSMFMMVFVVASYGVQEGNPPGEGHGCVNYDDLNGNGLYDVDEPCYDDTTGGPSFEEVDTDGDGLISHDEAEAAFGEEPDFEEHFADVDTNDDGYVDHAEFDAEGPEPPMPGEGEYVEGDSVMHEGEPPMAGSEGAMFHCPDCGAEFAYEDEMHSHMEEEHAGGEPPYPGSADYVPPPEGGDCAPGDDFHANCGAICAGMDDYYVDRDGDCEAEDGPFATWDEPDCPECPDDEGH